MTGSRFYGKDFSRRKITLPFNTKIFTRRKHDRIEIYGGEIYAETGRIALYLRHGKHRHHFQKVAKKKRRLLGN
jgi:hypothetical protein